MTKHYLNYLLTTALFILTSSLFVPYTLCSQINIQSIATDLNVCNESNPLTVSITPQQELSDILDLSISLPEGIEYTDNSLLVFESPNNVELSIDNLPNPSEILLSIALDEGTTWASGETLSFEIQRIAQCAAIDFAQIGGTFEDEVILYQSGTAIAAQEANYGIQFASLSIFQPNTVSGESGQKLFRKITLNNGGFACAEDVTYYVVLEQGLTIETIRFGTFDLPLTFSGDTVFASLNDILLGVGNGDTCFDDGESIELTEELRLYTCNTVLIETQHNVVWGCNENQCNPFSGTTGNVVVVGGADEPKIKIVPLQYNTPGTCTNGQGEFLVINEGTPSPNDPGYAISLLANLEWDFSQENLDCARDAGVMTNVTINGLPYDKGSYKAGQYRVNLAANKDPEFGLTDADGDGFYDDLLPGDTLHIQYEIDFACFEDCFCDVGLLTDISTLFYNNFCGSNLYERPIDSDFTVERSYQIPHASLSNPISVGQKGTLKVCSNIDQNLNCPSDQSKLLVYLSEGLALSPELPNAYLTDGSPLNATTQNDTIEVTGLEGISINCVNVDIVWTGEQDPETYGFSFDLLYQCESGCDCYEAIDCGSFERVPQVDPLTDSCVNIVQTKVGVTRQSYGWKDFDLQEKVDPETDSIRLQFALACDTIRFNTKTGIVLPLDSLNEIRVRLLYNTQNDTSELLEWLSGNLRWYDTQQSQYFDCTIPNEIVVLDAPEPSSRAIDFSIADLFASCSWDAAAFSEGDSLFLETDFLVLEEGLNNDFVINPSIKLQYYAYDFDNEEVRLECQAAVGNIQLYQNKPLLQDTNYVAQACIAQSLSIAWGNDIDTLQNGPTELDFFFNEIRPSIRFDSVAFRFPKSLQYIEGSARMNYFPNPIGDYYLSAPNVSEEDEDGLLQYTFVNDGSWPIGDRLNYLADTTGHEATNGYFQMDFWADCKGGNEVEATFYVENNYHSPNPDCRNHLVLHQTYPLSYEKPLIGANLITTSIDGVSGEVTAQLEYCNNSGQLNMPNAFLVFETSNGDITVLDANIGTIATLDDGLQILQLGDIAPLQCLDIELQLAYGNCAETSTLKPNFSWDCVVYPNSLEEVQCDNIARSININPKEAEVQLDVTTPTETALLCDTMYYEFTLNSAQLANIIDPVLILDLPPLQGLLLTDSTTIEYPLGTTPRGFTAAIEGNQLVIDLGLADAENEPSGNISALGISGFALGSSTDERKASIRLGFTTDCNFVAGSSIRASVFANLPCGAPAAGNGFSQLLPPIQIQDINNSYQTKLQIEALPIEACESSTNIEVKIFHADNQVIEEADAHCYVFLPEGLDYTDNSLQIVSGNVEEPLVEVIQTGNQLDFAIQFNDDVMDSIVFNFEVLLGENFACLGENIELIAQTVELQNANCSTDNENCSLAIQTNEGSAFFEIPTNGAAISLEAAIVTVDCAANEDEVELTVTLQNNGNQPSENLIGVDLYLDSNFNGILDEDDVLLGDILYEEVIEAGQSSSTTAIFGIAEVIGFPILIDLVTDDNCESCEETPLWIEGLSPVNNTLSVAEQLICIDDENYQVVLTIEGGLPPYSISGTVEGTANDPIFQTDTLDIGTAYSLTVTDSKGCFRQIEGIAECITLPIELIAFEGEVENQGNFLQWFTASETHNDFYTLERSQDGKLFEKIAILRGAGTTSIPQTYSFLDRFAPNGISYYRLSQTDFDATTRYVGTISLHRQTEAAFQIHRIYPVPTSDVLFVEFSNPSLQSLELELVNTLGQVVHRQIIAGNTLQIKVHCNHLQKGLYLLKLGGVWEKVVVR